MIEHLPLPRAARRPVAVAIRLAIGAALLSPPFAAVPAHAQPAQTRQSFDIPPGPLGATLTRIAEQGGVLLERATDWWVSVRAR